MRCLRALVLLFSIFTVCRTVRSQDAATSAFEEATIKPNKSGIPGGGFFPTPGQLTIKNRTLKALIEQTYRMMNYQVFGATGWMDSDAYDIVGKTSTKSNMTEEMAMVRALLADRFQLKFHRETRESPMYALLVSKGGHKLQPPTEGVRAGINVQRDGFAAHNYPFKEFLFFLIGNLDRAVVDETGISGSYDFTLKYNPDLSIESSEGVSIFTAIQDQLGLRLEARKGPVEVLVVDHAEKPAEN